MLAQPAADPHDRAVRWRQLVELVARAIRGDEDRELIDMAIAEIRAGAPGVDERVRATTALAIAPLRLPPDLVATFAADDISVAAPVLANARLTASEWKRVSASASEQCRRFIAAMHSEAGAAPPAPERRREGEGAVPSISDVVARIERLRQSREAEPAAPVPEQTPGELPRLFRWECNESGEIDWVEGVPRGPLIGRSIAQSGGEGGVDPSVERAFASRTPFHDGLLELANGGTVGGSWRISGVPAFEPATGRFAGYRGVAERSGQGEETSSIPADAASLRELAHEIKTPLNAIIGFAEIISGEYLGPAENQYRERANDIVAQARLLVGAVDDLDFAARIQSSGTSKARRVDMAALLERLIPPLRDMAETRGVSIEAATPAGSVAAAFDPQLAERLLLRLGQAVIGAAQDGERLQLSLDQTGEHCDLAISRPASLEGVDLRPERNRRADDKASLPMRLVMGLVRLAGGEFDATPDRITIRFPKA